MKKLICLLVISGCFFSYYFNGKPTIVEGLELANKQPISTFVQEKLVLIKSVTILRRGDVGIITIQGEPGVIYNLTSSFNDGNRTIPVNQWRTGDSKGLASFNWVVGEDTAAGTYPITISGGGQVLNLTHTVLP